MGNTIIKLKRKYSRKGNSINMINKLQAYIET